MFKEVPTYQDDIRYLRFLRARKFDVDAAYAMLSEDLVGIPNSFHPHGKEA